MEPEEFQMAPMIDMVFLLLVFFMTVSTLAQAQQRVELDLPESEEAKVPEDLANRTPVSIQRDGTLYWGAQPVPREELVERLAGLLAAEPDLRVQVRADHDTPFEHVRTALQACAEAGAYDVLYSTYEAN
jgi:biopolymer transport protein ExbD